MSQLYPHPIYDHPRKLLSLTGSLWSVTHPNQQLFQQLSSAMLAQSRECGMDLELAIRTYDRQAIPLRQQRQWQRITVRETEILPATNFYSGDVAAPAEGIQFSVPASAGQINMLCDQMTGARHVWIRGVDFVQSGTQIFLRQNIFELDDLDVTVKVQHAGNERSVTLFSFQPYGAQNLVHLYFGSVLRIAANMSERYKQLVNAVYDAALTASENAVRQALGAIFDVDLAQFSGEQVQQLAEDRQSRLVVTDRRVYRIWDPANALVQPGDVLTAGQPLGDALRFYSQVRGLPFSDLPEVYLPLRLLHPSLPGTVGFRNQTYTTTTVGTEISWPLLGEVGHVAAFWAFVRQREADLGYTLRERMTSIGPVATVNPLDFLFRHVLGNNCLVAYLRPYAIGNNPLAVDGDRVLRLMLPPATALLLLVEETPGSSPVTMTINDALALV